MSAFTLLSREISVFRAVYISISLNVFYLLPLHGCHAEVVVRFL